MTQLPLRTVTSCILIGMRRLFRETYCTLVQGRRMEELHFSVMSANLYQTARCHIPQYDSLHIFRVCIKRLQRVKCKTPIKIHSCKRRSSWKPAAGRLCSFVWSEAAILRNWALWGIMLVCLVFLAFVLTLRAAVSLPGGQSRRQSGRGTSQALCRACDSSAAYRSVSS